MKQYIKKVVAIGLLMAAPLMAVTWNSLTNTATESTIAADWIMRLDDPTVLSYKILVTDFRDWIQANLTSVTISGSPSITGSGAAILEIDGAGQSIELGDQATNPVVVEDDGDLQVKSRYVSGWEKFDFSLESPDNADIWYFHKTNAAIEVTDITCIVDPAGTGESVVIDVQECDASGDSCVTVDATITCSNTGAADDGTLTNGAIDSGDIMALDIGTVTGTVTNLQVTVWYKRSSAS